MTLDPERKLWVRGARLISIPRIPTLRRHSLVGELSEFQRLYNFALSTQHEAINAQTGISMRFTQQRDDEGRIVFQSFAPLPPGTRLTSLVVRIVA